MSKSGVSGIIWTKMLLPDKKTKILGIPNRIFIAVIGSAFCVFVEPDLLIIIIL